MKDKKLKKLMNEYASLPRTDMDKDMAKRTDSVDVVVGPVDEPSRRHPVRNYWARVAVGAAFAVVAAVAIPVAVTIVAKTPREGWALQTDGYDNEYASESANHADASIREDDGGRTGSEPGAQGGGSAGSIDYQGGQSSAGYPYEGNPKEMYSDSEIKVLTAQMYSVYYDGTYEDVQYASTTDSDVLAMAEGVQYTTTVVESDQGEVLIISPPTTASSSSASAPRFEIVVYPDYEGPLYRNASLTGSTSWRGLTIEYEAGKCIEIRFVTDGVYYYVKFVPQSGEEMTVQDVLDYLFA